MIEYLFLEIKKLNITDYQSLLFNIYEDETCYTIEASFDDDEYVIGRDNPFKICDLEKSWEDVEKDVGVKLKELIKADTKFFKPLKEITYGFVDGDLHYIKKSRTKKQQVVFTADDFVDFDAVRLKAWLTVYLTDEAQKKYGLKRFKTDFSKLTEEENLYWRTILAENFDYKKYNS
ncbi:MAG: hypothetical protein E7274_01365 [Pseudobutyrivibrio ruminis]|uniref:hypothetical protein n=1 Tax=Pseudobutyrivibrio ruminis TaxID=46206 RepID=UPI0026F1C5EA|nr:hypothetical protein [Pseudobutyrivibrio ruminis]MBE5912693.1 hypothetical protein [Pseudobutyrivibrio ruminis]